MPKQFGYQMQRMSQARSNLMIPHPHGEEESIMHALSDCALAFHDLKADDIEDDTARSHMEIIQRFMDVKGLDDPTGEGLYKQRARAMSSDEKLTLSKSVDELADYFHREFWSGSK